MQTPTRSHLMTQIRFRCALILPLVLACESTSFKPEPIRNDDQLYWALKLNHHAVMLSTTAPYHTLTLAAQPVNHRGEPLSSLPAPEFISRNVERVAVTSGGTLVGLAPTGAQSVWVVARLTTENLRHMDSVLVKVVGAADPPPTLESFSIQPVPPDSAKLAVRVHEYGVVQPYPLDTLRPRAADPGGVLFENLSVGAVPVYFSSSDSTIAQINRTTGSIVGLKPGRVTLSASTTVFGVKKEEVLPYRIGYPVSANITLGEPILNYPPGSILQPEYYVGMGASVTWAFIPVIQSQGGLIGPGGYKDIVNNALLFCSLVGGDFCDPFTIPQINLTFNETDLPNIASSALAISGSGSGSITSMNRCTNDWKAYTDCSNAGNIAIGGVFDPTQAPPYPLMAAVRKFSVPGTYEYHNTSLGTTGRIVVVNEQE